MLCPRHLIVLALILGACAILHAAPTPAPAAAAAPAPDPRVSVLLVGDLQSVPQGATSWVDILSAAHPDWDIHWNISSDRTLAKTLDEIDATLARYDRLDIIVIFLGTQAARKELYAVADAAKLETQLGALLKKIKAHPKGKTARIGVLTPVPVVEARVEKAAKDAYAGGEKRSQQIADVFRKAAAREKVAVIDLATWIRNDKDANGPGRLLDDAGWVIPEQGVPEMARFIDDALVKTFAPQPPDAAAFAEWKKIWDAYLKFNEILASTGEGLVAHGERLPSATFADITNRPATVAVVPFTWLRGLSLDLLVTTNSKTLACVSPLSDDGRSPIGRPFLTCTTDTGEAFNIYAPGTEWQLIDEEKPDAAVEPWRYSQEKGRQRSVAVLRNEPGRRSWLLIRFPLQAMAGKRISTCVVRFDHRQAGQVDANLLGDIAIYPITGADRTWNNVSATWKKRDGINGWTGGTVNVAERKRKLTEFLATNPPKAVADQAQWELGQLSE